MSNNKEFIETVGERIDSLVNLDVPSRNATSILYPLAREKSQGPLCLSAASVLQKTIHPQDVVFIATGFTERPDITPEIGETDGPPGAAALARALHRGLGAVPIILVEEQFVGGMSCVMQAAGFRVLSPDEAMAATRSFASIHVAAVTSFPTDIKEAKKRARELIKEYKPASIVVIEKSGMNDKGVIHGSFGTRNDAIAKIDYLVLEATKENIVTIGIGDGGNEVGMGLIQEGLKQSSIPFIAKCKCGCGGGIACTTSTDILVTAAVSNWGAYGVAACLAALLDMADVFHSAVVEETMLQAAAYASFIDSETGYVMPPGVDGLASPVHQALVTLLSEIVTQGLRFMKKEGS